MSAKRNTITWSAARVFVREWRRLFGDSSPLIKVNNEHDTKGETLFQVVPNWEGVNVQSSWGCRLPKCGIHRVCFVLPWPTSQTSHTTTYCLKKRFCIIKPHKDTPALIVISWLVKVICPKGVFPINENFSWLLPLREGGEGSDG